MGEEHNPARPAVCQPLTVDTVFDTGPLGLFVALHPTARGEAVGEQNPTWCGTSVVRRHSWGCWSGPWVVGWGGRACC